MENSYELILQKEAQETLIYLNSKQKQDYSNIIISLEDLSKSGLLSNNIKNIGNNIFRKRVGRWRILFTFIENKINIWIINLEKDTKKDYKKWKDYIISKI